MHGFCFCLSFHDLNINSCATMHGMAYRKIGIHLILFTLLILITAPALVYGAGIPEKIVTCDGVSIEGRGVECTVCHIAQAASNILNTGIFIAVFLSGILFAWAGGIYLTNIVNPSGIAKAKAFFGNVLVGLLIILGAWLVIDTILRMLVPNSGTLGPWNELCNTEVSK